MDYRHKNKKKKKKRPTGRSAHTRTEDVLLCRSSTYCLLHQVLRNAVGEDSTSWPLGLDATPISIIFDERIVCDKLSMVPQCFGTIRNGHEMQSPGACLLCARIPRGGTQEIIRCLYALASRRLHLLTSGRCHLRCGGRTPNQVEVAWRQRTTFSLAALLRSCV
jgi:hypothetical protein